MRIVGSRGEPNTIQPNILPTFTPHIEHRTAETADHKGKHFPRAPPDSSSVVNALAQQ